MSVPSPGLPDRSARVKPLIIKAGNLWYRSGVTSPKARHAIKAIVRSMLPAELDQRDPSRINQNARQQNLHAELMSGVRFIDAPAEAQSGVDSDAMYSAYAAAVDVGPTFNIESDPLFQQIFGINASLPQADS